MEVSKILLIFYGLLDFKWRRKLKKVIECYNLITPKYKIEYHVQTFNNGGPCFAN